MLPSPAEERNATWRQSRPGGGPRSRAGAVGIADDACRLPLRDCDQSRQAPAHRPRNELDVGRTRDVLARTGVESVEVHIGDAQLLVMGSSRRGLIGRVLINDNTQDAFNGAPCSVAVAPAGHARRAPLRRSPYPRTSSPARRLRSANRSTPMWSRPARGSPRQATSSPRRVRRGRGGADCLQRLGGHAGRGITRLWPGRPHDARAVSPRSWPALRAAR